MVSSFRRQARFEPLKTPANKNTMASSDAAAKDCSGSDGDVKIIKEEKEIVRARNEESVLLRSHFKKRRNHVIAPRDRRKNEKDIKDSSSPTLNFEPVMNTSMDNDGLVSSVLRPPSSPEYATGQYMNNPDQCWDRRDRGGVSPDSLDRSWDFSKPSFDLDNCWESPALSFSKGQGQSQDDKSWDSPNAFPFSISHNRKKGSSLKKSVSLSPEECLNDLLNFENSAESLNKNIGCDRKLSVKIRVQSTEEYGSKLATGQTKSEEAQSMTTAEKKSHDCDAEIFAYLTSPVCEDDAKSKSNKQVRNKQLRKKIIRSKVVLKGGDNGAFENSDEVKSDIGTELQYKTPNKTTKKQTTVVLPSHEQIYCEILTTSPSNGQERDNQHTSSAHNKSERNVKDADNISSFNLEEFSPFPFDDFHTKDLYNSRSNSESVSENSESFNSDSQTTFLPKQLCFTPKTNNKMERTIEDDYLPAPIKLAGEKDSRPVNQTEGKESVSKINLNGLIQKVVLKQNETLPNEPQHSLKKNLFQDSKLCSNDNGTQLKDTNFVTGNEFKDWSDGEFVKDSFERDNSPTIALEEKVLKNDEPEVRHDSTHSDGEQSLINSAARQDATSLDVKENACGAPSISVPSKRGFNVPDLKSILLTETMDVMKYIDSLVQDVKSEFEPTEGKNSESDNDSDFKEVLKSMVTDIVLGHNVAWAEKDNRSSSSDVEVSSVKSSTTDMDQCSTVQSVDNRLNNSKAVKTPDNVHQIKSGDSDMTEVGKTPNNLTEVKTTSNNAPTQQHRPMQNSEIYFEPKQALSSNLVLSPNDVTCFPSIETKTVEDGRKQSELFVEDEGSDEMGMLQENMVENKKVCDANNCPEMKYRKHESTFRVSKYTPLKGLPTISQRIAALQLNEK